MVVGAVKRREFARCDCDDRGGTSLGRVHQADLAEEASTREVVSHDVVLCDADDALANDKHVRAARGTHGGSANVRVQRLPALRSNIPEVPLSHNHVALQHVTRDEAADNSVHTIIIHADEEWHAADDILGRAKL